MGHESVYGRPLAEAHLDACVKVRSCGRRDTALGQLACRHLWQLAWAAQCSAAWRVRPAHPHSRWAACLLTSAISPPSSLPSCPLQAGLIISGINAEVMPGQWEFQIGPTGPLETGDQVCPGPGVQQSRGGWRAGRSAAWGTVCKLCGAQHARVRMCAAETAVPKPPFRACLLHPSTHPTHPLPSPQVMIARWLLHRLGEEFGIISTFAPKPMKGDW